MKRWLAAIMAMLMVFFAFSGICVATDTTISISGEYDIGDYGSDSMIIINSGLAVTLTNVGDATFSNVRIECGAGASLTLNGVRIDNSAVDGACPVAFTAGLNSLILEGSNILTAGANVPAVKIPEATGVEISETAATGSLTATATANAAGIGGGDGETPGGITILSGSLTAAGAAGAGIGGGNLGQGGIVNISGGTVVATGGLRAAGIGGSQSGAGGSVNISGGTVNATGGDYGAGIGGGESGTGGSVNISGGTVTANGGGSDSGIGGAGIGGGSYGSGGSITISAGTVNTTGTTGASIGGGYRGAGGTIRIQGGIITAAGTAGAGIGGGGGANSGLIVIEEGDITASASSGAGIGGGGGGECGTVRIEGGTVDASSTSTGAGIGGGSNAGNPRHAGNVLITGGTVTANGGGAGIGGGWEGSCTVAISNGTIQAYGGNGSAGIGGGRGADQSEITITGGDVTAAGGYSGAGIGGGLSNSSGKVTITSGTIHATGGQYGAGIGGGSSDGYGRLSGTGGTIKISGGTVYATAGSGAAGIGGGTSGNSGYITIEGGSITATASSAAGIGCGSSDATVDRITIKSGDVSATGSPGIGNAGMNDGGPIDISGGNITAVGEPYSAGIGGRFSGGAISISGGIIMATKGENGDYDIGGGRGYSGGTLSISGGANIFMKNNASLTASTTTHVKYTVDNITDGKFFNVTVPSGWTPVFGAYLPSSTLTYDANGGDGTAPAAVTQPVGTTTTVANGNSLSNGRLRLTSWNTAADGSGTSYLSGDDFSFTQNTTLYAVWEWVDVASVTLNDDDVTMVHHDTSVLLADVQPADASSPEVTWTSSDESVVTIDGTGRFEAVGVGEATITATADGKSDTCHVTVNKKSVSDVRLDIHDLPMIHHDTSALNVLVSPDNATYPEVTWTSSNETIAKVDQTGTVTAAGVGEATITVTADGVSDTCRVAVSKKPVTSVLLNKHSLSLIHHDTYSLTAQVLPADASYPEITWTSSDESVAAVDANGEVTAVSVGHAVITATADGLLDMCSVSVSKKPVTGLTLSQSYTKIETGKTVELTAQVLPDDATYPDVTWISSDETVAKVDQNGVITGISAGTVSISASADGISDTCQVFVIQRVTDVVMSESSLSLIHHDTAELGVQVLPNDATYPEVTWTSSDDSVLTVDQSGNIKALSVGTATVSTSADGVTSVCEVTVNKKPVDTVTLSQTDAAMIHHDTLQLTAQVMPADATYPDVTWESSNIKVATVDQAGNVEAVGTGSAIITAVADGMVGRCDVTINKKPVTSVTLNKQNSTLLHHDTVALAATVRPGDATYPDITWTSSDKTVATVDKNGNVTAVGIGQATVTAKADDVTAELALIVEKRPVSDLLLSSDSETLLLGQKTELTAKVIPNNATYPDITWTSSDKTVATVDKNGNVTAVGIGQATVTAKADDVTAELALTVVKRPVSDILLSSDGETLLVGQKTELTATVVPDNATYPDITWTSSDDQVATVDENGRVTAIDLGIATITAQADDVKAECQITVQAPEVKTVTVTGVLLDESDNPLAGYTVELHSDPMKTVTDETGRFVFNDVPVGSHTLKVMDNAGSSINSFEFNMNTNDNFSWDKSNKAVNVSLKENTNTVGLTIAVSDEATDVINVQDSKVLGGVVQKKNNAFWIYFVAAAAVLLVVMLMLLVVRIRKQDNHKRRVDL